MPDSGNGRHIVNDLVFKALLGLLALVIGVSGWFLAGIQTTVNAHTVTITQIQMMVEGIRTNSERIQRLEDAGRAQDKELGHLEDMQSTSKDDVARSLTTINREVDDLTIRMQTLISVFNSLQDTSPPINPGKKAPTH